MGYPASSTIGKASVIEPKNQFYLILIVIFSETTGGLNG